MVGKDKKQPPEKRVTRSISQDRTSQPDQNSEAGKMQDDKTPLSELTVGDLKLLLNGSLQPIQTQINSLVARLDDIESYRDTVDSVAAQVKTLSDQTLPKTVDHLNSMVEALALQNVNLNMHRRKFNLIIQGVTGDAKEESDETRKKTIAMAKDNLKIKSSPDRPLREDQLAACHRLSPDADSGIIARFNDLRERDRWLSHAKNLKGSDISICVDVPPCLRKAKKELMEIRKNLPPDVKKRAYVKYLPSWPYLQLNQPDSDPIHHTFTKSHIVSLAMGLGKDVCTLKLTGPNG